MGGHAGSDENLDLTQYSYLVKSCASYYSQQSGADYDDLYQEGWTGLLYAEKKFDEKKGKFENYAYYWIKVRIQQYLLNCMQIIREPYWRYIRRRKDENIYPLQTVHNQLESIKIKSNTNIELEYEKKERSDKLEKYIDKNLSNRDKQIIYYRYTKNLTFSDIAKLIGVSKERVRQILLDIHAMLREKDF